MAEYSGKEAALAAQAAAREAAEGHPPPPGVSLQTDFNPCVALYDAATAAYQAATHDFETGHPVAGHLHSLEGQVLLSAADACSHILH